MTSPLMDKEPVMTGASAVYPWSQGLARKFTLVDRYDEPFTMWERSGERIKLPRAACPLGEDRRIPGPSIHLESEFAPRSAEQTRVVDETTAFLQAGQSGILQATTGFGKTVCALEVIKRVGRKTLVIVPKEDLMGQWRQRINQFLPAAKVGMIRQNTYNVAGKDIVLGMIHSLGKSDRYPKSMAQEFGLVVWDEVHHVAAETFQHTAFAFPALLRLGLSAEPQRRDGRDVVLWSHIGPVRVETSVKLMEPTVALYQSPWKCPRRYGERMPHSAGKCGHVLNMVARHHGRTELISRLAVACYNGNRNLVVFSDRVAHLEQLRALAVRAGVPEEEQALYIGSMSQRTKETAPAKRIIWATYGMMAEGTDIPWLDTVLFATPRSSILQPMGRVLREWDGKPKPVVMDIVDLDSPVFEAYFNSRKRQYRDAGATVKWYGPQR